MLNNDILRRIRYALHFGDRAMLDMFRLGGTVLNLQSLHNILKKEEEEGYLPLNDKNMTAFLDGMIIKKRGVRETAAPTTGKTPQAGKTDKPVKPAPREYFNNNLILRKIKIALELIDEDLLTVLKRSEMEISKSELSALFRKRDHKNYKVCGDQLLRNFLAGLAGFKKGKADEAESVFSQ